MASERKVMLMGTRGLPAAHGGFETFLEHLAPFLVTKESRWFIASGMGEVELLMKNIKVLNS